MANVRISKAAERLGVHPQTLRDLERRGVIKPRRDWAGYRVFDDAELLKIERCLFYGEKGEEK